MNYKFNLAPQLKTYVEFELKHYYELQRELDEYRNDRLPPMTVATDGITTSGGKPGDPTADTAIRFVTDIHIKRVETNCRAIERALTGIDDTDTKLIGLVYWRSTHTVQGAACIVNISTSQAYRRLNKILCLIALEMGEINI